jgi:16S rRNA (guanine966-N2)-methyltransferase
MLGARVQRILAGTHRGRRLRAPAGLDTRPMLAVVRGSLFQVAAPWLPGGQVLDLFAGSGALGLEALSRGASAVVAVERAPAALAALRANVEQLGAGESVQVVEGDALDLSLAGPGPFDLVLLDPPFPLVREAAGRGQVGAALRQLEAGLLAAEGLIVLHLPRGLSAEGEFPASLARVERVHGGQSIWYLQRR